MPLSRRYPKAPGPLDLGRFGNLVHRLADTQDGHDFRAAIQQLVEGPIKNAIQGAPAWEADWPRMPTRPVAPPAAFKSRLA